MKIFLSMLLLGTVNASELKENESIETRENIDLLTKEIEKKQFEIDILESQKPEIKDNCKKSYPNKEQAEKACKIHVAAIKKTKEELENLLQQLDNVPERRNEIEGGSKPIVPSTTTETPTPVTTTETSPPVTTTTETPTPVTTTTETSPLLLLPATTTKPPTPVTTTETPTPVTTTTETPTETNNRNATTSNNTNSTINDHGRLNLSRN